MLTAEEQQRAAHWVETAADRLSEINTDQILDAVLEDRMRFNGIRTAIAETYPLAQELHGRWTAVHQLLPMAINRRIFENLVEYADALVQCAREAIEMLSNMKSIPPGSDSWNNRLDGINGRSRAASVQLVDRSPSLLAIVMAGSQEARSNEFGALNSEWKNLAESQQQVDDMIATMDKKTTSLEAFLARANKAESTGAFADRSKSHRNAQRAWAVATAVAFIAAVFVVDQIFKISVGDRPSWPVVGLDIFKHAVLLSGASVALRVSLKRWSLERNLSIVYAHRVAALNQFDTFAASMPEHERESREHLRLELARILFADPNTGYREDSATEFNLSPVVSIAESALKRAQSPST